VVASLVLFAVDLAAMAVLTDSRPALVVGIVERPVASSAYSFVRFSGGAVAPYVAGRLGEDVSVHAPFWMGAGVVLVAVLVPVAGRRTLENRSSRRRTAGRQPRTDRRGDLD
jgi:MFS family permease